ncbi:unnamed protein product [Effrenium voratum]|nr:unnamed protein product [Effrenium voratum]
MGRRHFTFAAPPRAMQESMKQGCQVKIDDGQKPSSLVDSENILSRRHFAREVSGGGTPTCLEISSRRHFADIEHQESCPEANDCDIGKKHVRGRSAQLHGSVQVTGTETASGKRCDFSHRPQRRSGAPQRRHLQCKEHLLWSGAVAGQVDVPAQGIRCSAASPTLDSQVAKLLSGDGDVQQETLVCSGPRSHTPAKRHVEVQDNLVGGTLRCRNGPDLTQRSRCSVTDRTSLLGVAQVYARCSPIRCVLKRRRII